MKCWVKVVTKALFSYKNLHFSWLSACDGTGYSEHLSTLAFGGTQDSGATSVNDCINSCNALIDCLAFDYDLALNECFLHLNPNYLDFVSKPIEGQVVTQYRKVDCACKYDVLKL